MSQTHDVRRRAFRAAFPYTIPILAGFGFMGMSYGFLMRASGFSALYTVLMSVLVFGGSIQFVAVNLLQAPFHPAQTFLMALMVNARHLFYGISLMDRYRDLGWKKPYMVFGLCDETFSVNFSARPPEHVDRGWFMFFVTVLDHLYWVLGTAAGALLGSVIHINTKGLEFVMTAMFTVIFLEQLQKGKQAASGLAGLGISLVCLLLFGADGFVIPAMAAIVAVLAVMRKPLEKAEVGK